LSSKIAFVADPKTPSRTKKSEMIEVYYGL